MRSLIVFLLLVVSAACGCKAQDWQPKQPYLEGYKYSSDDYTQDKWSR